MFEAEGISLLVTCGPLALKDAAVKAFVSKCVWISLRTERDNTCGKKLAAASTWTKCGETYLYRPNDFLCCQQQVELHYSSTNQSISIHLLVRQPAFRCFLVNSLIHYAFILSLLIVGD